ncbi:MAG: histidine kinase [Kineosporiaceae bacterium]
MSTPTDQDSPVEAPPWRTLTTGQSARAESEPVDVRRVVLQVIGAALAVLLLVGAVGVVVVRRMAEREALNDASHLTDLLARAVVMPSLEDALLDGDAAARQRFDVVVRERVLSKDFVRVKLWSPDGVVLYSDEAALIGETFPLGEEQRAVLAVPATVAEVSDLAPQENRLERDQGRLVEVYRPVWTPSGKPLLFETYTDYGTVTDRTVNLWRGFGGTMISTLLLFAVLMTPLIWALLDRLRRARMSREVLLQHAIDASQDERRRIAADLHDGVVQELVAASLLVSGATERASARGDGEQAAHLRSAAGAVRASVASLRTLLVDIYPPNLTSAGLAVALEDLGAGLRGRGVEVIVDVDPDAPALLDERGQRLVYRTTQECLRNVLKHSGAHQAEVSLHAEDALVVLEVADDGAGVSEAALDGTTTQGHFGLRLLADLARDHGATLRVSTAPTRGTRWRLEITP